MFRSRPFLLFILILLLGLTIEGLKSFNDIRAPKNNKIGAAIGSLDMTPFRVSEKTMREERLRLIQGQKLQRKAGFHLAGQTKATEKYDLSEGHKVAEKAKVASKEDNKKKKRKKKIGRTKKPTETKTLSENKTEIAKNNNSGNNTTDTTTTNGGANLNAAQEDKLPVTYEDWAKLILGSPQPNNILKLVEYFQANMVTGEVFYALTDALVQDSNEKQQELGIYAVRQIHSLRSFEFLVDVLKTEQQGSNLAAKTNDAINEYQALNRVSVLKSVLSTHISEASYVQLAVNLIDSSTRTQIENRENREPSAAEVADPEQAATRLAQRRTRLLQIYRGFVPLLETVITTFSGRSEITGPAQNALARIRDLGVVADQTNG